MNQQYSLQKLDDFTCSGPRPPVPGEETRRKMTEVSHSDRSKDGSPPSYVRWAQKLGNLLEDGDGAELFKRYVELEGEEPSNRLKFYFACEGLKQQTDPEKITQLIGAIYRRFLKKAQPGSELYVNEALRNFIKSGLKNELILTSDIFDQMQSDVANIIGETTYPHFLQSDLYLQYVQNIQSSSSSSSVIGSGSNSNLGAPTASTSGAGGSTSAAGSGGCSNSNASGGSSSSLGMMGFGMSCSLTNSSSTSDLFTLSSSALPTLHEDAELVNADSIEQLYGATGPGVDSLMALGSGSSNNPLLPPPPAPPGAMPPPSTSSSKVPMTLTRNALIATQKRRLEIPPGTRGYSVYTAYAPYNPVSRRDSELASLSSGRTDSDTMSLSSISTDGRPHSQRKHYHHHHSSMEKRIMRENALTNEEVDTFSIIPRTHRHTQKQPPPMEFAKILINKLECVAREQEKDELLCKKLQEAELSDRSQNKVLADAIRQKLQVDDDNDQDILDQHVSRVWSDLTPSRSPGTMSPCPPNAIGSRSRRHELAGFGPVGASSSMRHSKSMPEGHPLMGQPMQPMAAPLSSGSRKLNHKWPSVNTDSGISLFSTDTLTKHSSSGGSSGSRGELSLGGSSRPLSRNMHDMHTATLLQESSRRLEDETRRSKRYQYPLPPSAIQSMPLPPVPMSSVGFGSLPPAMPPPPIPAKPHQAPNEFTIVVYSFCDEEVPYRIKIPGTQPPTLRQFKDYLPKKGNYRFFFKTRCEDLDNPVIQEEVSSDNEPLPLFEGKVMGTVKPSE